MFRQFVELLARLSQSRCRNVSVGRERDREEIGHGDQQRLLWKDRQLDGSRAERRRGAKKQPAQRKRR